MTISAEALRELHRIHRQLADLRNRLARGPKQIQASEGAAAQMKQEYDTIKEKVTRAKVASDEKQLQLKIREDRIADLQAKLNTAGSNKEYQALKEQMAADEQANSVLSDEILEALEKIDELEAALADAQSNSQKSGEELNKVKSRVESEQATLESELARVSGELDAAEAQLDGDFKTDYLRISKARGEDALAEVDGETCGGCYSLMTPQMMNELYLGKPVFCKSCGCLLYLPEDRSVGGK